MKGRTQMAVTYKKLWHILLDRDMKKKDLQETANSQNTQCVNWAMMKPLQQIPLLKYAEL